MSEATFRPRLNHVAISMDPAVLDARGRADVLAFYGEVFGWTEGDNTGEKGNPLILNTGTFAQFVYLLPATPPMQAPPLDHFGLQVSTLGEIDAIVDAARRFSGATTGSASSNANRARRTARPTTTRSRARTSDTCCR